VARITVGEVFDHVDCFRIADVHSESSCHIHEAGLWLEQFAKLRAALNCTGNARVWNINPDEPQETQNSRAHGLMRRVVVRDCSAPNRLFEVVPVTNGTCVL